MRKSKFRNESLKNDVITSVINVYFNFLYLKVLNDNNLKGIWKFTELKCFGSFLNFVQV